MQEHELIEWFANESGQGDYIVIPEDILRTIDGSRAEQLSKHFGHNTLIRLPISEIDFFEWLRESDYKVWNDLWGGTDEDPYVVGISFLPLLIEKNGRGFPICDLMNNDNYYFSMSHMVDEESKAMIESSRERFMEGLELTVAQLLAVEISIAPIDIWHFAYKHNISLEIAKDAVHQMTEDHVLVHLKEAGHLAHFIDF